MRVTRLQKILAGLAVAGCLLLSGPASADRPGNGQARGNRGQMMIQRMTSELNLTEDQAAKIREIFKSRKGEMRTVQERMKTIFTDEQRAGLRELRKNNNGNRDRAAMRQKMQQLGITREQMRQMRTLRQQVKADRESVQSEIAAVLTPEQNKKYEQMRQQRLEKWGQRGEGAQRGRRGQRGRFRNTDQ